MSRLLFLPAVGALLLLGACADSGLGRTQLSQADLDSQAALNACKAEVYGQSPLPNGDQSYRLAGEPHGRDIYWYEGVDRHIDDCLATRAEASAS